MVEVSFEFEELEIVLERGNYGLCLFFFVDCILFIDIIILVCDYFFLNFFDC